MIHAFRIYIFNLDITMFIFILTFHQFDLVSTTSVSTAVPESNINDQHDRPLKETSQRECEKTQFLKLWKAGMDPNVGQWLY